jgi:hypothetical protein
MGVSAQLRRIDRCWMQGGHEVVIEALPSNERFYVEKKFSLNGALEPDFYQWSYAAVYPGKRSCTKSKSIDYAYYHSTCVPDDSDKHLSILNILR